MFARSALRVSARAVPSVSKVARATFATTGTKLHADGFKPQREVPVSSYAGGEVQRSTIPVTSSSSPPVGDAVTPLTRELYNSMPKNMQKMTLMDKVVVVTGYVLPNFLALRLLQGGFLTSDQRCTRPW